MSDTTPFQRPVLTPEDHAFFLEHGYLFVKNVVPSETVAEAVAFLEGGSYEGDPGSATYQPRTGNPVAACVTDTVFRVMEELLGPEYPISRHGGGADMPRPYTPDKPWVSQGFHVDSDYPTLMPSDDVLSYFLFLTPVRSHGGAFQYALGSPFRYFAAMGDNTEQLSQRTATPELAGDIQEYLAEPGDLLIFTHLGGHAGSNNVTDPQTRHALLDRYYPLRRFVPGLKPFEAMSSAEKVYSARWLREIKGLPIPEPGLVQDVETDTALREGLVVAPDIITYETFIERGNPGLLFVTASAPDKIQRARSRDFVQWKTDTAHEFPGMLIHSLHDYKRDLGATFLLGTDSGETGLFKGADISESVRTGTLPDSAFGFAHYTTRFGSRIANGIILFRCPVNHREQIRCGWAHTWEEVLQTPKETLAAELPAGMQFADALINPTCGGPPFALIADVQQIGSTVTRPYYSISRDVAYFEAPLEPLGCTGEIPPKCLRVYARAHHYWLVTYLQENMGVTRLFWGAIDWKQTPIALTPLQTALELQQALCTVGWI